MTKTAFTLLSVFSVLWALFIVRVYPLGVPVNSTSPYREPQRLFRRTDGRETARLLCANDDGLHQADDSWKPCMKLFYDQYGSGGTAFMQDLLWAPQQWHNTIFTDKQCPQLWQQDGCQIVIDCTDPTPISYQTIFLLLKQILGRCFRKQLNNKGGFAFVADQLSARHWWIMVTARTVKYGSDESSQLRQEMLRLKDKGILLDLNGLALSEVNSITKLVGFGPNWSVVPEMPWDMPVGWDDLF